MPFLACYFSATRPYESENCSTMEAARQADEYIEQFSLSEGLVQKLEGGIDRNKQGDLRELQYFFQYRHIGGNEHSIHRVFLLR